MKNWFKIYRAIEDHELYFAEPFTRIQAWIDLVMIANYKDSIMFVRGNEIEVKRGFIAYSEESLAKRWQWSKGKVQRFKKWLEIRQQIVQHKSKILSQIEIVNYEKYQQNESTDESTDEPQTDDRQVTSKKVKKVKNNIIINNNTFFEKNENIENLENENFSKNQNSDLLEKKEPEIINSEEQKNSSKQKNKEIISSMIQYLVGLLNKKKIAGFKNPQEAVKRRVWNIVQMVMKKENPIAKEELQRRIHIILSNPCKNLGCWTNKDGAVIHKCNDIEKLFEAIKGFVEPKKEESEPIQRF